MNELGDYLKRLRGRTSLREAAKKSGLSHSYINSLEHGVHPKTGAPIHPSPEMLKGLAKAYNHPYKDLMVKAGYSYDDKEESSIEPTKLEGYAKQMADLVRSVKSEEKAKKLLDFAEEFFGK